jgi:Flp pilus assembly protein TadB
MSEIEERAEALRALAGLLRAGMGPHAALGEWHKDSPPTFRPDLLRMARRISLGRRPADAVADLGSVLGGDAAGVAAIIAMHTELGGDVVHVLDRLASAIAGRASSGRAGRAASAGALLSGRLVAGLPLLLVPLAPLADAPLLDALGIVMLMTGAALAVFGMWWIGRLIPRPPSGDDPAALIADTVAAAVRVGVPLGTALVSAASGPAAQLSDSLRRARRLVVLGAPWPEALSYSGDEVLTGIAAAAGRAYRLGAPVADALEMHADRCREGAVHRFEESLRRAPVLMVLPLSFCVLPAYAVLGLGPYLRTMATGV